MKPLELANKLAIVQPKTVDKAILVKLKSRKDRLVGVVQNNSIAVEPDLIDLEQDDILCLFMDDNPKPGTVYKCKVEPFYSAMKASNWGTVYFYRNLAEAEKNSLMKAMTKVYSNFIKANKLKFVLPITMEIRPNDGQMQGYYRHEKKGVEHAIVLCPTSFIAEGGYKNIETLLVHEVGHPLHKIYLPNEYKEKWIRLYSSYNIIKDLTLEDLQSAHEDFINSGELPSAYRKQLEEDHKAIFNAVLKYIKNAYRLKLEHLDILVEQKNSKLNKYWPKSKLQLSEIQTPISKYAGTNPTELFTESLAAWYSGAEIPKDVRKLVKESLKAMLPK